MTSETVIGQCAANALHTLVVRSLVTMQMIFFSKQRQNKQIAGISLR